MSRSTRSTMNNPVIDRPAVPEKLDAKMKKNVSNSELLKSTGVVPRKFTLSKTLDSKDVSSKEPTREMMTTRRRNLIETKQLEEVTSTQGTLSEKTKSSRVISSIGDKSKRNVIKIEPSCTETIKHAFGRRSSITVKNETIDKPSNIVAVNTSKVLGVVNVRPIKHYNSLSDVNSRGLFNLSSFTTACSIDSVNFGFACQSCRVVRFKTYAELRVHEDWCGSTVREDKFYKCRNCERKYHSQTVLSRHESECKQDEACVQKREFANPFDFTTIFAPDFRDFPFFCTSCHVVSFRTLDEMRIHENWCGMVMIGMLGSVVCENCGIAFRSATVLTGHRQGPPGCSRMMVGRRKRCSSPLKNTGISEAVNSKRRKLNQSVTASKIKKKFTVVLCSKRKCISQKSAKTATASSAIKVEQSSLDSSVECSPISKRRTMQETKKRLSSANMNKDDCINYSCKSISTSQSRKNDVDVAEDMILESAISGADQASSVPGYLDTEKKSCPVCDVTIVGSVDDMCLHFQQFHNIALSTNSRDSSRPMLGRMGPTNCLDCNTLFDTRLEMTRHKQVCTKKLVQKPSILKFICAICSVTCESRDKFNMHVHTFHGGADAYQQVLFGKTMLNHLKPGPSSLPSVSDSINMNEQTMVNEIKAEIDAETNITPVVPNSKVLGVVVPLKGVTQRCSVDLPSDVEVGQKSPSHASNETTSIAHVGTKKSTKIVTKNPLVQLSDIESCSDSLSKNISKKISTISSGTESNHAIIIADDLEVVQPSLRVEDMVASVTVNSSLRKEEGSQGCVGKIRGDHNPADLQPNLRQDGGAKKSSNPQLPVVFDTCALQRIFLKNDRRRLRLQTTLIPGSEIVVVGTEDVKTSTTLKTKNPTDTNTNKLREDIEQNKLANVGAKSISVVGTGLTQTGVVNISETINHNSLLAGNKDAPSTGIDQDVEQKRLLLALQLVPCTSFQSAESKDDTQIIRKSKRQMAKQIDGVEISTVEKRAMEIIACQRDIKSNSGISSLNKDLKAKNSSNSELINTSSNACKTSEVPASPRLSTHSTSDLNVRKYKSTSELTEAEQQNKHIHELSSLSDQQDRKQNDESISPALSTHSEEYIEKQSEPFVSTSLMQVQSELALTDTVLPPGECVVKHSVTLSTDEMKFDQKPTEVVSDQTEPKASKSCEMIPAKKNSRRNLRILEPIDDETLKCLECGSILCTAIEIVSHTCPD